MKQKGQNLTELVPNENITQMLFLAVKVNSK